jgi:hypothetical protein
MVEELSGTWASKLKVLDYVDYKRIACLNQSATISAGVLRFGEGVWVAYYSRSDDDDDSMRNAYSITSNVSSMHRWRAMERLVDPTNVSAIARSYS